MANLKIREISSETATKIPTSADGEIRSLPDKSV
jgi:hypothetical protein